MKTGEQVKDIVQFSGGNDAFVPYVVETYLGDVFSSDSFEDFIRSVPSNFISVATEDLGERIGLLIGVASRSPDDDYAKGLLDLKGNDDLEMVDPSDSENDESDHSQSGGFLKPNTLIDIPRLVELARAFDGKKPVEIFPELTEDSSIIMKGENSDEQQSYEAFDVEGVSNFVRAKIYKIVSLNVLFSLLETREQREEFLSVFEQDEFLRKNYLHPHLFHPLLNDAESTEERLVILQRMIDFGLEIDANTLLLLLSDVTADDLQDVLNKMFSYESCSQAFSPNVNLIERLIKQSRSAKFRKIIVDWVCNDADTVPSSESWKLLVECSDTPLEAAQHLGLIKKLVDHGYFEGAASIDRRYMVQSVINASMKLSGKFMEFLDWLEERGVPFDDNLILVLKKSISIDEVLEKLNLSDKRDELSDCLVEVIEGEVKVLVVDDSDKDFGEGKWIAVNKKKWNIVRGVLGVADSLFCIKHYLKKFTNITLKEEDLNGIEFDYRFARILKIVLDGCVEPLSVFGSPVEIDLEKDYLLYRNGGNNRASDLYNFIYGLARETCLYNEKGEEDVSEFSHVDDLMIVVKKMLDDGVVPTDEFMSNIGIKSGWSDFYLKFMDLMSENDFEVKEMYCDFASGIFTFDEEDLSWIKFYEFLAKKANALDPVFVAVESFKCRLEKREIIRAKAVEQGTVREGAKIKIEIAGQTPVQFVEKFDLNDSKKSLVAEQLEPFMPEIMDAQLVELLSFLKGENGKKEQVASKVDVFVDNLEVALAAGEIGFEALTEIFTKADLQGTQVKKAFGRVKEMCVEAGADDFVEFLKKSAKSARKKGKNGKK
jgi:hypothetical protein